MYFLVLFLLICSTLYESENLSIYEWFCLKDKIKRRPCCANIFSNFFLLKINLFQIVPNFFFSLPLFDLNNSRKIWWQCNGIFRDFFAIYRPPPWNIFLYIILTCEKINTSEESSWINCSFLIIFFCFRNHRMKTSFFLINIRCYFSSFFPIFLLIFILKNQIRYFGGIY